MRPHVHHSRAARLVTAAPVAALLAFVACASPLSAQSPPSASAVEAAAQARAYFKGNSFTDGSSGEFSLMYYRASEPCVHHLGNLLGLRSLVIYPSGVSCHENVQDPEFFRLLTRHKRLQRLSISGGPFDDADMQYVAELKELERLELAHVPITDAALETLADLPRLTSLSLVDAQASGRGLQSLKAGSLESITLCGKSFAGPALESVAEIESLRELKLLGTAVDNSDLAPLAALPRLERLHLHFQDQLQGDYVRHIARMHSLVELDVVQGTQPVRPRADTDAEPVEPDEDPWAAIGQLGELESLNLQGPLLTRAGYAAIGHLPRLRRLRLFDADSDLGLVELAASESVQEVEFWGPVTSKGMAGLAQIKTLKKLTLRERNLADEHLEPLGRIANLEELDVSETSITDAGIAHLAGLTRLRRLEIKRTAVTDAGLLTLAQLPRLEYVDAIDTRTTREGSEKLREARPGLYQAVDAPP